MCWPSTRNSAQRDDPCEYPPALVEHAAPLKRTGSGFAVFRLGLPSSYNGFSPKERDASSAFIRKLERSGWRRPTVCVACRQDRGIIDLHLEDYSQPWDPARLIPLCTRCHLFPVHSRHIYPRETAKYRDRVRAGYRAPAIYRRNLGLVIGEHVGKPDLVRWEFIGVPTRFILDEIAAGLLCPPGRLPGNASCAPGRMPSEKADS